MKITLQPGEDAYSSEIPNCTATGSFPFLTSHLGAFWEGAWPWGCPKMEDTSVKMPTSCSLQWPVSSLPATLPSWSPLPNPPIPTSNSHTVFLRLIKRLFMRDQHHITTNGSPWHLATPHQVMANIIITKYVHPLEKQLPQRVSKL